MRSDFCVFILSHGRPRNVITLDTIHRYGYNGDWYIVCDNEDDTIDEYREVYGGDNILCFNKLTQQNKFDTMDNFDDRRTIVYARNACFELAKELGYRYFIELDDDYYYFGIRTPDGACKITDLDKVFEYLVEYMEATNISSVAFSQGGDHIGGYDETKLCKRKAMNSFICCVDRPVEFVGRINEDVNTYISKGALGDIFLTIMNLQLDQKDTQTNDGGMSDTYAMSGTYVKSFYSVICAPSCVKVKAIGVSHIRMHHSIEWEYAVPKIIDEHYKKH